MHDFPVAKWLPIKLIYNLKKNKVISKREYFAKLAKNTLPSVR